MTSAAPTLSLAMIVRNEQAALPRVLGDCAPYCDQLVVVDTGSTDGTVAVAESMGAVVEHFTWIDDFAAARNAALDACTGDWILWLDADDRLRPEAAARLREWLPELDQRQLDGLFAPYRIYADEASTVMLLSYPRERVIRRSGGFRWVGPVHEILDVPMSGLLAVEDVWVEHRPPAGSRVSNGGRNLRILERAVAGGDRSLRTLFYLGNELRDAGRNDDAIVSYDEYLAGAPLGWERYSALCSKAACHVRSDRPAAAVEVYRQAIAEDGGRAEAYLHLGVIFFRAGEWAAAAPMFGAATACVDPGFGFVEPAAYSYLAWDYLAVCHWRLGRHREAMEALAKATPGNPDLARLVDNARWIMTDLNAVTS